MSYQDESDEKPAVMDQCVPVEHPNLMPGWGCCNCRTYNSNFHKECRVCSHKRCDIDPANKVN